MNGEGGFGKMIKRKEVKKTNRKIEVVGNLSNSLLLPRIFAKALGFDNSQKILELFATEGCRTYDFFNDRSNFMEKILIIYHNEKESLFNWYNEELLLNFDMNIKTHMDRINTSLSDPISLKPFQYLSLL